MMIPVRYIMGCGRENRPANLYVESIPRNPDVMYITFFERQPAPAHYTRTQQLIVWAATLINPRFEHCQLMFRWDDERRTGPTTTITESIVATFGTTMKFPGAFSDVRYLHSGWHGFPVRDPNVIGRAFQWCLAHEHAQFNYTGFYWNFIPCVPSFLAVRSANTYFCAELVVTALQSSGYPHLASLDPHTATPTSMYNALLKAGQKELKLVYFSGLPTVWQPPC